MATDPTFSRTGTGWCRDLDALTALAESTLLMAMDVANVPSRLVPTSPAVQRFLVDSRTVSKWLGLAESALDKAEMELTLSPKDIRLWEDKLLHVKGVVEQVRAVALDLDHAATAAGADATGLATGLATGPSQGGPVPPQPPAPPQLATVLSQRAQLLGFGDGDRPTTRIASASLVRRSSEAVDDDPLSPRLADADPHQLLQMQQLAFEEQDSHLDALAHAVTRQKHVAVAIHDELDDQVELLDGMTEGVDTIQSRLQGAQRRLERVGATMNQTSPWCVIASLVVLLVLILVIL